MNSQFPDNYHQIQSEISKILSNDMSLFAEERSRDRLLRIRKGMAHILCEVFPQIDDPKKQELCYWLEAIARISGAEAADVKAEVEA
ncbi:TPA: hypothetical protein RG728_002984 [Morganella morganii subsp. morganii]|uniref:Transcriptional regulator n=1 Tax=Morganella morganii TaxID=582 RepID=A0AAU8ZJJ4_MORMO|nr:MULTISPECIES: hypothetical protein [Morganella]HDU8693840.1 hypothetical protein [Morganella morganii subsp. morganii]AWC93189.1 hypothetical protein AM380_05825 [Morganella morganii]AZP27289.1 hypothetical protein D8758_18235 [Morganella morganii]EKW8487193.1 hypothetical protein [Morganella morganii]OFV01026.1 hypothetical protein HMPREF3119_06610 [Morganella sp. HMSC11D09]